MGRNETFQKMMIYYVATIIRQLVLMYLKRTNFRVDLFSRVQKSCILRVLIFANGRFQKSSRVLIFANPLELSFGYGQLFKFKIKFEISR